MSEKIYQFNEYILGYDKGLNDRSCLTISKIQNGNMYVMSSLYDGSAEVLSLMLDNLQSEIKKLNIQLNKADNKNLELLELINKNYDIIENKDIKEIEERLKIQELLESKGE